MTENFNLETFRSKAQTVLENKNLVSANEYVTQLENLLLETQPGSSQRYSEPSYEELKGYLEKARARINSLFYNAPVGYCILDAQSTIVEANKAFCYLIGLDQTNISGHNLKKYVHPESAELLIFQVNKIINSKTTLSTNLRFLKGDKEIFIRFQTTYYAEGGKDYLQCIATDISDTKAIENELAASEAQFHNLLEATPLGIIVLFKGKCIYSNTAGAVLFEYDHPDELIGMNAFDTIAEAYKPLMASRLERLEKNIPNEPIEIEILCKDGKFKTCETASIPVIFNNRLSALILITDISERKNTETLLRQNEQKHKEMHQLLRLMCDNVPDLIWAKDLNDQYIFTNKAVSEKFLNAADTDEPVGKTDAYFIQRERELHPEIPDWHTFNAICTDVENTVISSKSVQRFDVQGNALGKHLHLDILKAPFFDSEGAIIGIVGSGRDVSHEKWLQSEHDKLFDSLTEQSARLQAVVNVLPDLMFVMNLEGNFLDFFTADTTKLVVKPDSIKKMNLNDLFDQDEVKRQLDIYRECVETKKVLTFDYTMMIGGSKQYFEARIAPISENNVLAIVRDITQKKQNEHQLKLYTTELLAAKEKAEESDRLKSAFLANMSHEIRTPMNSIMGFADLLNESDLDAADRKQYTDIIIGRSADLLQIINDILDISRIESGNVMLINASFDLNKLLDELNTAFTAKLALKPNSKVRLVCEKAINIGGFIIEADELKLKQIFVNLLDNAIKFTQQGSVRFGYQMPENGSITCFVADTGIGIEQKFHEIIFERFRQADIPDRIIYKGTGLGLAICKGNAELMGGTIGVESQPGKGSMFFFSVPFVQRLEDGSINTTDKIISGYSWKGKNIVIVEDDENNVKYFQTILQNTGASVFHADNSTQLKKLIAELDPIDVVLMDIHLPGEDGWQLTRYIKSVRDNIPVIAQTALGMEADKLKSFEAGCDNFLAKPISSEALLRMMAVYLEGNESI
jgi:PAS domain S-box-containing protein